ncbi:hypothetical protein MBUL_03186 [Methylobacterium bullatum]|uniref:Serine protease n=1 Tax=Methylobacterium bullatum TaxID=570505 RepID=A0A679IZN7_9HYPH|nr:hypothetical protein MBUL_03186 [Methylobacterium bullatum]
MTKRDPGRLAEYLKLITRKRGGVDGALAELESARSTEGPLATTESMGGEVSREVPVDLVREGVHAVERGHEPTEDEVGSMEAIIYADLRPAADVIDGRFTFTHPLWVHLTNDDATRQRIEKAMPSIGRIELPGQTRLPYGGTGFVVGPNLLMTNRHVAALFADGLGDRQIAFKSGAQAGIDFLRERDRPTGPTLVVRKVVMIHPFWDMAILRVEGLPAAHEPLKLSLQDARDLTGREIFVVGYPAFDPRNPADVQNDLFNRQYGVKRLQPGELQGGFDTGSFGKTVRAATHDCSTLGGNSGSAVIDVKSGEVLALHFGGRYQERNYCVPSFAMSIDRRIVDVGVDFAASPTGGPNNWGDWWKRADADTIKAAPPDRPATSQPTDVASDGDRGSRIDQSVALPGGGAVQIEIPLRISISLGSASFAASTLKPSEETSVSTETEAMVAPEHDTDYASRHGYDPAFLDPTAASVLVPMPKAADPSVLAAVRGGGSVLHYQNFSIAMHGARRLALICASNVTKEPGLRRPEEGRDYTRRGLSGLGPNDQERWFIDPRIDERFQLPDAFFTKDRGAFDKGHLVRRDDVAWGETYDDLRRANGDTYHVTNCSPQIANFNRSASGEANWGDLENIILSDAANERLCVLAGPVLDPADLTFVGVGDDRTVLRARIPSRFWKVVIARVEEGLAAFGFVLEQDLVDTDVEFAVPSEFRPALTSLDDIATMAGIVFAPALLMADQVFTSRADEIIARSDVRRRQRNTARPAA